MVRPERCKAMPISSVIAETLVARISSVTGSSCIEERPFHHQDAVPVGAYGPAGRNPQAGVIPLHHDRSFRRGAGPEILAAADRRLDPGSVVKDATTRPRLNPPDSGWQHRKIE